MSPKIQTIGVIGTGTIGSSWTGLFLAQGYKVLVSDPAPGAADKLAKYIKEIWPTLEELGLAPGADPENYEFVGASLGDRFKDVDFIQEVKRPERPDIKIKLFAEIDAKTRPDVIIASSSSGIPSSQFISECKQNPSRILIGHPFNPPHLMPLVEVVPHPGCSEDVIDQTLEIYKSMGKRPIRVNQELPGHAANRLQAAVISEAFSLVHRGVLSAEDVDACITTSLGPRWALTGPMMSMVFAGGGGKGGFIHHVTHLGAAMEVWLKDMKANEIHVNEDTAKVLDESVQQQLAKYDPVETEKQRDQLLVRLLNDKKTASLIV